jgi:type II secretory pathway pseudopilin PulG
MTNQVLPRSCRGVRRGEPRYNAFTLIELILVVGIIMVLAGLVLTTVGYARKKGARARAETEIAAMSAACENYKADNAVYPRDNPTPGYTDTKHLYERQFIFVHAAQRIEPKSDADYRRKKLFFVQTTNALNRYERERDRY